MLHRRLLLPLLMLLGWPISAQGQAIPAGAARVDITPKYPVRLSGFGFRRTESEGITQNIVACALALGSDRDGPAVVIAVDNLGVPDSIVEEIARRLKKAGVSREKLTITATHTHTAPMLTNVAPTLFGQPIPKDHQERIDRYTREFTDALEKAALAALRERQPATLEWGVGKVKFAVNRRTRGGPVDHDLPVLVVRDERGTVRAIWVSYACHAVTLSNNKISGDWPGFARETIERYFPRAVALVSIGCGADSNPSSGVTGERVEAAREQGAQIASEVRRLLQGKLHRLPGKLTAKLARIELPFDTLPTKTQWEELAKRPGAVGYHAKVQLERLARGEKLQTKLDYPIQTWDFAGKLAVVNLPGEVVVDYSLRLKKELDSARLWINAYANDAPCYIPSERILREGGYEGGGAMIYYDRPTKLKTGIEDKIVTEVKRQLPDYKANQGRAKPLSPRDSLARIKVRPGMTVELVAAEPLVVDPVAIDFGPDGRLWVAEMCDYPLGLDGKFSPGGRVKVLDDTDGDGKYDRATVFLERVPFPTGITVWRKGVLVCAAPDVLFAEDTDGDGKADRVTKLLTGFATHNYQARVNSLHYGLDGWVYGSAGLFGSRIRSFRGKEVQLTGRDFRFKPDTGEIEPVSGLSQQGRVRDDWGNWFGCDSGTLARHYPLVDQYVARNRHVAPPPASVSLARDSRLFPVGELQLFKLSGPPGRPTAVCGLSVYRDELLGPEFAGNLFTCEPVNLLVHRLVPAARGATFTAGRARGEEQAEFLASSDGWFRPVQVRTGPDGALWIVDMYRQVIEHPRWIPPENLESLDLRAGDTMGRIYRVHPRDKLPRKLVRLDKLDTPGLVSALDSPNGPQRDLAHQMLLWKQDRQAVAPLRKLLQSAQRPQARLEALCVLDGLKSLEARLLETALADPAPGVRRHALRLAGPWLAQEVSLGEAVLKRVTDTDPQVRMQLAWTLGDWNDPRAARALARLALQERDDVYLLSAVLSSVNAKNVAAITAEVLSSRPDATTQAKVLRPLLGLVAALGEKDSLPRVLAEVSTPQQGRLAGWQMEALAEVLQTLQRRRLTVAELLDSAGQKQLDAALALARKIAADAAAPEAERRAAVGLLGRSAEDIAVLGQLLNPRHPLEVQTAAVAALGRSPQTSASRQLLAGWSSAGPALRPAILDTLLGRETWIAELLLALEKGDLRPAHIDATRRDRLLRHRDASLRKRAEKVFGGLADPDRARVVSAYRTATTMTGYATRGRAVFVKCCASCHRLDGHGNEVGPDLTALSDRSPQTLLVAILDPNRAVEARFVAYQATLRDGRIFTGLLVSETAASVSLRDQEGRTRVLLRRDLESLVSTALSMMPEGMEKDLSQQDLADLFTYLARAERPKDCPGNFPAVVAPDRHGRLTLSAARCEIYGGEITFEPQFQNIGLWHGERDRVVWRVRVEQSGRYDVHLDWACHPDSAGNAFILEADSPLRGKVASTGGWDRYRQEKVGTITLPAGTSVLTLRPDGPLVRRALLDLRTVYLVPAGTPLTLAEAKPQDRTAADLARELLDDKVPAAQRQKLIAENVQRAPEIIREMTRDLKDDPKEEYRRIPWIWRVSIAAGRSNQAAVLKRLLDVSLPGQDQPLRDWQAVVVGGGVINGISDAGLQPGDRVAEILRGDAALLARWKRALELAVAMADDEKVKTGTRYDALRMLGVETWERRGQQLVKYLKKGTHAELQMGAVSGLGDMKGPEAARALLAALPDLTPGNRNLALNALVRGSERAGILLDAVEKGQLQRADLGDARVDRLLKHPDEKIRTRAEKLLKR